MVGLPWQLAQQMLQAANIPFAVTIGENYNRFFTVADNDFYVGRVAYVEEMGIWQILLYRPMVASGFENCNEVQYAKEITT
ncbi:hypothetical protein [Veillonella intestinalis]|nr:hypothetical protein [Veillonella intestinalis]